MSDCETTTVCPPASGFGWPHNGSISSYYGWRLHPVLGYERLHAGIDLAGEGACVLDYRCVLVGQTFKRFDRLLKGVGVRAHLPLS